MQGGPLSPLLSNIVLDELDQELEKRGLEFCRFADDCNIFVKSQKAAERVMETISQFIEKLARPHVVVPDMEAAYRELAADQAREQDALEWSEGLIGDCSPADSHAAR